MDALNLLQGLIKLEPLIPTPHLKTSRLYCMFQKVNNEIIIDKLKLQ